MLSLLLIWFLLFAVFTAFGFAVFYFGSKPTERELDRREALMSALVLGLTASLTWFLGLSGLGLTFFFVVSALVKVYDCGLANSILMTAVAMLLAVGLFVALRSGLEAINLLAA